MIDPLHITNFNRTETALQEFLLFAIVVAGKNSKVQARKLADFLALCCFDHVRDNYPNVSHNPFAWIRSLSKEQVEGILCEVKMGQYTRITNAFCALAHDNPDLKTITIEGLERIKGIGPKTARFFMLHSFENAKCAVLDTHILKYLRDCGYNAPKTTPQNRKTYRKLELQFIELWEKTNQGLTLADFDLKIWKKYAK